MLSDCCLTYSVTLVPEMLLHPVVRSPTMHADRVHAADVWVIQCCKANGACSEAIAHPLHLLSTRLQHLEGLGAVQARMHDLIDAPVPAGTEEALDTLAAGELASVASAPRSVWIRSQSSGNRVTSSAAIDDATDAEDHRKLATVRYDDVTCLNARVGTIDERLLHNLLGSNASRGVVSPPPRPIRWEIKRVGDTDDVIRS